MTVKDLMWPVLSLALDAIIWRHDPRGGFVEVLVLTACAALGMALGIVRVHGRSIPSWLLVILLFYLHPRIALGNFQANALRIFNGCRHFRIA